MRKRLMSLVIAGVLASSTAFTTYAGEEHLPQFKGSISKYTESYSIIDKPESVAKDKTWNIKFNRNVRNKKIDKSMIRVIDINGNEQPVIITKGSTDEIVQVKAPLGGYTAGEVYTLIVAKSADVKLRDDVVLPFVIKEEEIPVLVETKGYTDSQTIELESFVIGQSTNTKEISIHSDVLITLDESVNSKSINKDTVLVTNSKGELVNVDFNGGSNHIKVKAPEEGYEYGEAYTITVTEGVTGAWRYAAVREPFSISFTTEKTVPLNLAQFPYDRKYLYKYDMKESDWAHINSDMPRELYNYDYDNVYRDSHLTRGKDAFPALNSNYRNSLPDSDNRKWNMWEFDLQLETVLGYVNSKYNYDYKDSQAFDKFKKYINSGAWMGFDNDRNKIYNDVYYSNLFNELKNNQVTTKANFITDKSLIYYNGPAVVVRGRLEITYTHATSEFLNKYGLELNKPYYIDKEIQCGNSQVFDYKNWEPVRWPVELEFNLSGLIK